MGRSMMPLAPTSTDFPVAVRPKIGFSIDSIVGGSSNGGKAGLKPNISPDVERRIRAEPYFSSHHHHHQLSPPYARHLQNTPSRSDTSSISPPPVSPEPSSTDLRSLKSPASENNHGHSSGPESSPPPSKSVLAGRTEFGPPSNHHQHPTSITNGPPPPPMHPLPHQFASYPHGILNFAAAAAAAASQQHNPHHPHAHLPPWMQGHAHHHHAAAAAAANHPLYPWLLAKHSRLFPHHRFGPGPDLPGFLLQPFRKPKRIRTAFSPSQLLKLEHAFERNHYVVGAERKQLANSLALTETQVKVWFQNRRTKHKRVEQDETPSSKERSSAPSGSTSTTTADSSTSNSNRRDYDGMSSEDEEILMDEDEDELCLSDEEAEQRDRQRQHLEMLQQQQQRMKP